MKPRKIQKTNRMLIVAVVAAIAGCATEGVLPSIGERVQTSAALSNFSSCQELHATLKEHLIQETRVQLLSQKNSNGNIFGLATMADVAGATNKSTAPQEGVDFSGTNNQEAGVDEADFVKTDGTFIYILNGNRLEIMDVEQVGSLTAVSSTKFEGHPQQMLIGDDRAIVFSSIPSIDIPLDHPVRALIGAATADVGISWWPWSQAVTKVTVVDITDRTKPVIKRELYIEGNYKTARKVASTIRMVSYAAMNLPGLQTYPVLSDAYHQLSFDSPKRKTMLDKAIAKAIAANETAIDAAPLRSFVPQMYERNAVDTLITHRFTDLDCQNFAIADDGMGRGITSILSLNLLDPTFDFDAKHLVTNNGHIYASKDVLLVAEAAHDAWWFWDNDDFDEASNIHRFDISVGGASTYTGSGRILGTINNQFSLSEFEGNIRVAATTGRWARWWRMDATPSESHVYVLNGDTQLDTIGHVGGIAKGEQLWSARFVGDKGYLVTFRNLDPLWTIDLSDPQMPKVIGEVEVPGVSTYIHPLGAGHLLTMGVDASFGAQVSLFDVTDFANPSLASKLPLSLPKPFNGWSGSWSEATWEHKAFQYFAPKKLLAIPVSSYRYNWDKITGGSTYEYYSRLQLITVDPTSTTGLSTFGFIDHSNFFKQKSASLWRYRDVRRSIFMGDYLYAISDLGITAHDLTTMKLSASLPLLGSADQPYWR